jgi:2-haloacid dehalogenase
MQIKALVFDVFGTVVDWRTSIIREVRAFGEGHGIAGDWAGFADRWREGYTSGMAHANAGNDAWKKVDDIHRTRLDILLGELDLPNVPEHEIVELNRSWHRLDPWPDSVAGLSRGQDRFSSTISCSGTLGKSNSPSRISKRVR